MQAESIDDLIERSSLGTTVVRQLRGRTSAATVDAVRFKAGLTPRTQPGPSKPAVASPSSSAASACSRDIDAAALQPTAAGSSRTTTMASPKTQESHPHGPTIVGGVVDFDTSFPHPHVAIESSEWDPTWPDADIIVLPGIPGWAAPNADQDVPNPHPASTTDFVKVLSGAGFNVQYITDRSDRSPISINAAEFWVPVLVFALQDATCVPSDILIAAIRQVLGPLFSEQSRLHVRFKQENIDGAVHEFESHGRAKDVLNAMRVFGETHRHS